MGSEGTQEALKKLSDGLKKELIIHTNTEHLKALSFFNNFSQELKIQLMNIMAEKIFQPGQIIFEDGEQENNSIYLINKGRVELCYDTRRSGSKYSVVKEIADNSVFGQISFLTGFPRKCHAISKEICSLICVDREQFIKLLKESREEKDLQIFCQIRDKFIHEGDLSALDLNCFQCGSNNHLSDSCIKTHYCIHRNAILKVISSNFKQIKRKKFKRFRNSKENSLLNRNEMSQNIAMFVEKHEEQINFLQEEIQMKRFCNLQSQNNLKQVGSSEYFLPHTNSDDQNETYQSSESSVTEQEETNSQLTNSQAISELQVVSEREVSISNKMRKDSNQNTSGGQPKARLVKQKSNSMLNIQCQPQSPGSSKNIIATSPKNGGQGAATTGNIGNARMSAKNMNNQGMSFTSISNISANQNAASDIQNEELDDYLSINNEQTIGSIFHQDKKKQNTSDLQLAKQRSSYKQTNDKSIHSLSTFSAIPQQQQQRVSSIQKSSPNISQQAPKISVSCSNFDQNTPSGNNLSNSQALPQSIKKGSIRQSFTFNNGNYMTNNYADTRKSFTQKENDTSSSTESNNDFLFDQQLAPLTTFYSQPQVLHNSNGFDQGNIFIIEGPIQSNQQEEKLPKRSKFDLLQEKMNNDSDSTPASLMESIYNVDTYPTASHNHSKRKGILPQSTSLSENMIKIARLYSKGSTKTSNGIGQVLNLQMLNQKTHKITYENPNDIAPLMNFDRMKSYRYYYPLCNIENVLPELKQNKKEKITSILDRI